MYQTWKVVGELESASVRAVVPNLKEMQQQGWFLIEVVKTSGTESNQTFCPGHALQ